MNVILRKIKNIAKRVLNVKSIFLLNESYVYPEEWIKSRTFYGQYGEDIKIWQLFKNTSVPGFFLEIGAMEGIRFSNTYFFEKKGWKGICVEPHPYYFNLLRKNRGGSIMIQAAVGAADAEETVFYSNYRGSMSTLDKSLEGYFKKHYKPFFGGFKEIKVPLMTLNSILSKENISSPIDILSIDVEGTEADVLKGLNMKKYSPRVIVAEISIRKDPVMNFLRDAGYFFSCSNNSNAIFCKTEDDAETVRCANVVGMQIVNRHPLEK